VSAVGGEALGPGASIEQPTRRLIRPLPGAPAAPLEVVSCCCASTQVLGSMFGAIGHRDAADRTRWSRRHWRWTSSRATNGLIGAATNGLIGVAAGQDYACSLTRGTNTSRLCFAPRTDNQVRTEAWSQVEPVW